MTDERYLCDASDLAPGEMRQVLVPDRDLTLVVYNLDGEFHCTDDVCTHALAHLSGGDVEDGLIVCPLHGGAFDIRTGEAVRPPCRRPLKTYPVVRRNGAVYARLDA